MRKLTLMVTVLLAVSLSVQAYTFDGDYRGDVFFTNANGAYWYEGTGANNTIANTGVYISDNTSIDDTTAISVGYLDNDSAMDLAVGSGGGIGTRWHENDGSNSLYYVGGAAYADRRIGAHVTANRLGIVDYDDDGDNGLYFAQENANSYIYETDGDNSAYDEGGGVITGGVAAIGTSNFDFINSVFVGRTGSSNVDFYMPDTANNTISYKNRIVLDNGLKAIDIASGNFDGDELMDVFIVSDNGQVLYYEFVDRSYWSGTLATLKQTFDSTAQCVAIGDVDGDAISELLVGSATGLNWYEADASDMPDLVIGTCPGVDIRDIAIAEVPEPATMALLALGSFALIRKRK